MALVVYKFYSNNGTLKPYAALSDDGQVHSYNDYMLETLQGMDEAEIIDRYDNGLSFLVQQYPDSVARRIWNRWGKNDGK